MADKETLNTVQQVLRGVVIATGALNPAGVEKMAAALQAFAAHPGIDETARVMLLDLAEGLDAIRGRKPS